MTHQRTRRRDVWRRRVAVIAVVAMCALATACSDDEVVQQAPPPAAQGGAERATPSAAARQAQASDRKRTRSAAAPVKVADGLWSPRIGERVQLQGRDPFYGFVDELLAERARAEEEARQAAELEEEPLKPAQRFDVLDFQLVAVITNTAQPKALLIDPHGQAHRLRTGDLIGKKNGVIVDIRRNEIEILQGENLLEGERVVMKLHPDPPPGVRVEVQ